jgi:hypothetical protein
MIIVNRDGDYISGSFNGEHFSVSFDQQKYDLMLNLQTRANKSENMDQLHAVIEEFKVLTQENYKDKVETASSYIVGNKHTNKFYLRYGDKVSSLALPNVFAEKLLKSVDKGIDISPLIKCIARFLRPVIGRPDRTESDLAMFARYIDADYTNEEKVQQLMSNDGLSKEVATRKATTKQVSITLEGLLVCYKVSREIMEKYSLNEKEELEKRSRFGAEVDEDTGVITYKKADYAEDRVFEPYIMGQRGDEFYCGEKKGHKIRVGLSIYLEKWDQVGRPGEKGLHCGGLNYIRGYQQEGSVTHNIFVDPMDIHTIAGLGIGNDGAMTVRRYFVHSTFDSVNKNIYHSSTYAALTDTEYAKIVEEVVKAHEMKQKEAMELIEFNKGLGVASADSKGGHEAKAAGDVFGK